VTSSSNGQIPAPSRQHHVARLIPSISATSSMATVAVSLGVPALSNVTYVHDRPASTGYHLSWKVGPSDPGSVGPSSPQPAAISATTAAWSSPLRHGVALISSVASSSTPIMLRHARTATKPAHDFLRVSVFGTRPSSPTRLRTRRRQCLAAADRQAAANPTQCDSTFDRRWYRADSRGRI
jgi:hypothetical protein